jgi:hypothetical protein
MNAIDAYRRLQELWNGRKPYVITPSFGSTRVFVLCTGDELESIHKSLRYGAQIGKMLFISTALPARWLHTMVFQASMAQWWPAKPGIAGPALQKHFLDQARNTIAPEAFVEELHFFLEWHESLGTEKFMRELRPLDEARRHVADHHSTAALSGLPGWTHPELTDKNALANADKDSSGNAARILTRLAQTTVRLEDVFALLVAINRFQKGETFRVPASFKDAALALTNRVCNPPILERSDGSQGILLMEYAGYTSRETISTLANVLAAAQRVMLPVLTPVPETVLEPEPVPAPKPAAAVTAAPVVVPKPETPSGSPVNRGESEPEPETGPRTPVGPTPEGQKLVVDALCALLEGEATREEITAFAEKRGDLLAPFEADAQAFVTSQELTAETVEIELLNELIALAESRRSELKESLKTDALQVSALAKRVNASVQAQRQLDEFMKTTT